VEPFPRYSVPGFPSQRASFNKLHHESAFSDCTLWVSEKKRQQYRASFLNRKIGEDGDFSIQQHRGMAPSEGWSITGAGEMGIDPGTITTLPFRYCTIVAPFARPGGSR
jgi:hypothetical protein